MGITTQEVEEALAREPETVPGGYTDRDSLLYAVAIGMARDPLDEKELEYTCETLGDRVVEEVERVVAHPAKSGPGRSVSAPPRAPPPSPCWRAAS